MDKLSLNSILKKLEEPCQINSSDGFSYAKICSALLSENQLSLARKLAIRILNHWHEMDSQLYPIWSELMESLGFYPYLIGKEMGLEVNSLDNNLRLSYHESPFLPSMTLHEGQKEVSDLLFSGQNVVLSAPTSFGKSLLIEELVASHKYTNIVIIQPTLALLDETRIKLLKYSDSYRLIVRTTQEYDEVGNNIFLLTAERVVEYEKFPTIDFMIIDEFYKISYAREDDRVDTLNNAFMRIYYEFHPQFYFLGPSIMSISSSFQRDFNAKFLLTDYSLVDSVEIKETNPNDTKPEKLRKLFELLVTRPLGEQTLVYCSSPEKARCLALAYYEFLTDKNISPRYQKLPLVDWIKKEIGTKWSVVKELEYGIAIHDGALPKHLGSSIIRYFNNHQLDVIFCTTTIIEGVNTSAKNVVLFSETKGRNRKIDYFDYSNIKGRAGRLMEHYVGNVYTFNGEPPQKELNIDMPFSDQCDDLSDEVLVNIPSNQVKEQLKERYEELHQMPEGLLTIIKRNGISIKKQKLFCGKVVKYLKTGQTDILWKQMPKWDNLMATLSLLFESTILCPDQRVRSARQLCFFLQRYYTCKTIVKYFASFYNGNEANYDKELEDAFYVQRQWFQYAVPKALRVAESIINYVCGNKTCCSYSYYAQQLETNFLPDNLSILLEYGIPAITIRKMERLIPKNITEEELVSYIKKHQEIKKSLLYYESDLLDHNF